MCRRIGWLALIAAAAWAGLTVPAAAQEKAPGGKLRVVIIDGQNNHNWRATTPFMKQVLEDSGRFSVAVATSPQMPPTPPQPKKPKDETDAKAMAKYKEEVAKYDAGLPKYKAELKAAQEAFAKWRIDFDQYD